MKKSLLILVSVFASVSLVNAQDECMQFFPNTEGSTLTSKSYDGNNTLLATTVYTITKSYDYLDRDEIFVDAVTSDANNQVVDRSTLNAYCDDNNFYFKMDNRTMVPGLVNVLSEDTQLVGSFLDYPDPFADNIYDMQRGPFKMDGGEFTIKTKNGSADDRMRVRVYNRQLEKNEEITTPAGNFHAAKIKFTVETTQDGQTNTFKGVEWYTTRAGIVRTEIYDKDDTLLNYTVLTELDIKK